MVMSFSKEGREHPSPIANLGLKAYFQGLWLLVLGRIITYNYNHLKFVLRFIEGGVCDCSFLSTMGRKLTMINPLFGMNTVDGAEIPNNHRLDV